MIHFFFQLLLLAGALTIGYFIDDYHLIPKSLFKVQEKPYKIEDLKSIYLIYTIIHGVLFAISRTFHRGSIFQTTKAFVKELYYVTLGTVLCTFSIFVFTAIYFNISYYFGIYLGHLILYFSIFLICAWRSRSDRNSHLKWILECKFLSTIVKSMFDTSSMIILFISCIPVALFYGYKKDVRIANMINNVRVYFNTAGKLSEWALTDYYQDLLFRQLIQIRSTPKDPKQVYALEREGKLYKIIHGPKPEKQLVLDFSHRVGIFEIENGAVGFNFHPEFGQKDSPNAGFVYVYYTDVQPDKPWYCRLSRFDLSIENIQDRIASETVLIDQERNKEGFHNGASIEFGSDSFMYLGLGDVTDRKNHQTISRNLYAGILRIDVDMRGGEISHPIKQQPLEGKTANYFIPNDNPFCNQEGVLEEFWALGLRNPYRCSFDHETKQLWAGEVGANSWEEVNLITKGGNYQWSYGEGPKIYRDPPLPFIGVDQKPIYSYAHNAYRRAIIGGFIYRGNKFPELYGHYVFADNFGGYIISIDPKEKEIKERLLARSTFLGHMGITSLMQSAEGDILITVLGSHNEPKGKVLNLVKKGKNQMGTSSANQQTEEVSFETVSEKYSIYCTRCHGENGEGIEEVFHDLNLSPPNFASNEWQQKTSDDHIIQVIKKGGTAVGMNAGMPPWEQFFSEAEWDLLLKKIRSFKKGETPENP